MISRAVGLIAPALAVTIAAAAAQPPAEDAAASFAPGPARDTVVRVCGSCHTPDSAVAQLRTHEDWAKTLDRMAENGASASDEEWTQIQVYLDKNYSPIFVNKATARELETTLDIPADAAAAIVRRRVDKGEFKSADELKAVPGVVGSAVDARKDRLIF